MKIVMIVMMMNTINQHNHSALHNLFPPTPPRPFTLQPCHGCSCIFRPSFLQQKVIGCHSFACHLSKF
jgi:hypothetical protein